MNEHSASNFTLLLQNYLRTPDKVDSDDVLTELIEVCVDPLLNNLIRGKLHVSLQPNDDQRVNQDARDLVSEVKMLVVARLSDIRTGAVTARIDNLEAYVKTVATNTTNEYLRKKYPNRLRLKNQLRYLLTHDRRLALWNTDNDDWFCGTRDLVDLGIGQEHIRSLSPIEDQLTKEFERDGISADRIELVDLVITIFQRSQKPLLFGELVALVTGLRQISEPVEVLDTDALRESARDYENDFLDRMEHSAFLKRLWEEIGRLPLRHRAALLLNLRNDQGDALITLLPLTRVASIRQIADMLEFPVEEFARVWNELPWDDKAISEYYHLTRQQVINLRHSARTTLRRRLGNF